MFHDIQSVGDSKVRILSFLLPLQQQENLKLLAHFKMKFIIHKGKRGVQPREGASLPVEFFHIRANGSPLATRCIQVKPNAAILNSEFW